MGTDSQLTRRTVLRLGFFTGIGMGLVGFVPLLNSQEHRILAAVLDRIYPARDGHPPPSETSAIDAAEAYISMLPRKQSLQVRGLLRFAEWDPVVPSLTRFTRLSPEDQDAWLLRQSQSKWAVRRQAFSALKMLGAVGVWQQDARWSSIGYPGPLLER